MAASDEHFLRLTIDLARQARQRGVEPFAAVLVLDDVVVHQALEGRIETSDPTFHAELRVMSEYCRLTKRLSLKGYTLYASTEPCPMCSGAIHWARLSRLVFSVSQAMLQRLSGGSPKPGCASIINTGVPQTEIVGPLLPEEGLSVFEGYKFV